MNLGKVWIIFKKEFLDMVRDRRTIISMILLPIVIFPLLIYGLGSFVSSQVQEMEQRKSPVAIIGNQWSAGLDVALTGADLQVMTTVKDTSVVLKMLQEHTLQAILVVPENFDAIAGLDRPREDSLKLVIWYDKSSVESEIVMGKIRVALDDYRQLLVQKQLSARHLPYSVIEPFTIQPTNRASASQMAGATLGMFLPYMVILLALTGCTYPAIDLTAGEKERGTMETLLVSPASRLELVLGKFLTTMLIGLITATLTVISLFVSFLSGASVFQQGGGSASLHLEPLAFIMIFLLFIPVAALFASVLIAIAVNARSYKEAQSYVYPLIILSIIPAITSMMPGVEASVRLALTPVVNVSLTLRNALMGIYDGNLILLTFLSSLVYAAIGIFIAVRVFQKESVLLRT